MTTPPSHDDDISAAIDGQADEATTERLASDPAAGRRQAGLERAAAAVAQPVPPLPPDVVDDLIDRAVDAAATDDGATDPPDGVVPLRPRRASGRRGRWLVAATVVVLAAVGLGLLWSGIRSDRDVNPATSRSDQSAAASTTTGNAALRAAPAPADHGGAGTSASESGGTTTTPGSSLEVTTVPLLGDFTSPAALRQALRTGLPADRPASREKSLITALDRCAAVVQAQLGADATKQVAAASISGRPVLVYVLRSTPPGRTTPADLVVAVDRGACTPQVSFYRLP